MRNRESSELREKVAFQHFFIVMNPASGSAKTERLKAYAETRAKDLGMTVDFHVLRPKDDLAAILSEAADKGAEVFVGAGGDGTLAAVATQAYRHRKVLGVIPSGTANVFAVEHSIPKKLEEAIDLLFERAAAQPVDLLLVDGKVFLCHISIGTYSWITTMTPVKAKKAFGRIAYIWNTIAIMLKEKIWTFDLVIDGKRLVRRASTIMVTNAGSMGATGMRWGENIDSADGVAEICVIRARSFKHYLVLFWHFLRKKPHKHLKEYFLVKNEATITGPGDLPIRADGEKIGHGEFTFQVKKHGLLVLIPDRSVH